MNYLCCQDRRRHDAIATQQTINGIDFLEVIDDPSAADSQRQRTLLVNFINPLAPNSLGAANVRIEGGERITAVQVTGASNGSGAQANILTVTVASPGDFSVYTLRIVGAAGLTQPPPGFDPMLSAIDFSFKVACPSDFDCRAARVCPVSPVTPPEISYLAKDYASFRRLMLDRIAVLAPQWQEQNPADMGIALIELLAYAGDSLSYRQDAVATEAYLGTARRRVSVRRHARLVDYSMNDGSNARTWVQVQVINDTVRPSPNDPPPVPPGTRLATFIPGQLPRIPTNVPALDQLLDQSTAIFEIMEPVPDGLYQAHNEIKFYTWGALECCLPKGAVEATVAGAFPNLKKGDVLIFEETCGPLSGSKGDAATGHRCAVRLTADGVVTQDPLGGRFADPPSNVPVDVTEIQWSTDDALPFGLCISSRTDPEHGGNVITNVSVARGNVVLADHGRTIGNEPLGSVPAPSLFRVTSGDDRCNPQLPSPVYPRYRPELARGPLTQAVPIADPPGPASTTLIGDPSKALPAIQLKDDAGRVWNVRSDLLASDDSATDFVVEVEDQDSSILRFGDDINGARPAAGSSFTGSYRIGNGKTGNIGRDALVHIFSDNPAIAGIRNPLPAQGGMEPEAIEDVRLRAPSAFRTQERAVVLEDYEAVAERHPQVQRAAATFQWTGSWQTIFVSVDRLGGLPVDESFKVDMRQLFDEFRMAGYDFEIGNPRFVSLEIEMVVYAQPDSYRADVELGLLGVFINKVAADGTLGVFHPDNFTFGQTVYASPLYAAALKVPGVSSVQITKLQRQGNPVGDGSASGALPIGRLEIARLENDPNFPEHGVFGLIMRGGK